MQQWLLDYIMFYADVEEFLEATASDLERTFEIARFAQMHTTHGDCLESMATQCGTLVNFAEKLCGTDRMASSAASEIGTTCHFCLANKHVNNDLLVV